MRSVLGFGDDDRMIIGAVRCPTYWVALSHRNRHQEPAGQALRAALTESMFRAAEPYPGQASRSRMVLRHRLVASVFRGVRDRPFAGMFYGPARRLGRAKALDGRQRLHPLPPSRTAARSAYIAFASGAKPKA